MSCPHVLDSMWITQHVSPTDNGSSVTQSVSKKKHLQMTTDAHDWCTLSGALPAPLDELILAFLLSLCDKVSPLCRNSFEVISTWSFLLLLALTKLNFCPISSLTRVMLHSESVKSCSMGISKLTKPTHGMAGWVF